MIKNKRPFAPFEDGEEMEDLPDLSVSGQIDTFEIKKELGAEEGEAKVKYLKIVDLVTVIESYKFTCDAGPLVKCAMWRELKGLIYESQPD